MAHVFPDPNLPSRPFPERAQTAGVEHRFGEMGLNGGMGHGNRAPAAAYGMPQQQQSAGAAYHAGASQHTGYAQHQGIPLDLSPKYHSFKLERVNPKNLDKTLDKTTAWTVVDREIHPMTPEKMKERIAEYDKTPKPKKKSKAKAGAPVLVARDSPDMNPSRQKHIEQLAQDLAYHEPGPIFTWKPIYIKLMPETPAKISKWKSLIVIMRGDRRQGQAPVPSILKYPLQARIDISEDRIKDAHQNLLLGLPPKYEYPSLKGPARPVPQAQHFHAQSWSGPEQHPTRSHPTAQHPDRVQPAWTNQSRDQQHPTWSPQDRGQQHSAWPPQDRTQQQSGWAAHDRAQRQSEWASQDRDRPQSTWKAQESAARPSPLKTVPIVQLHESQGGHPKAQTHKTSPIIPLNNSHGGQPKAQSFKAVPIIPLSDLEGDHPKAQTHKRSPIIDIGSSRSWFDDQQRRGGRVPASPSASDSSSKTRSSNSTARSQTPPTVYTLSDTGATTGSRRSGKADRRRSPSSERPPRRAKESSHKYRPDIIEREPRERELREREPPNREHRRQDPQEWESRSKVEKDGKTHKNSSYSRYDIDEDEIIVQPASNRKNRHKTSRRESHGGYREHTRYDNTEDSKSHRQSTDRSRRSGERRRSSSVSSISSSSSDSYASRDKVEYVSSDDDADSMDGRGPHTRGPRPRLTRRLSGRDSMHARREHNGRGEREVPIVRESRSQRKHEQRRDRDRDAW